MSNQTEKPGHPATAGDDRAWYLVYTKRTQERVAYDNLSRQGYTVYLPRYKQTVRRESTPYQRETALFPRYLFVHLSTERDNWGPIRSTLGVSHVVKFGDSFASVPDELIEAMHRLEDETGLHAAPKRRVKQGDRVLIESGPFSGYEAVFQEEKGADRVILLMDIIAKHTRLSIPAALLRRE